MRGMGEASNVQRPESSLRPRGSEIRPEATLERANGDARDQAGTETKNVPKYVRLWLMTAAEPAE